MSELGIECERGSAFDNLLQRYIQSNEWKRQWSAKIKGEFGVQRIEDLFNLATKFRQSLQSKDQRLTELGQLLHAKDYQLR